MSLQISAVQSKSLAVIKSERNSQHEGIKHKPNGLWNRDAEIVSILITLQNDI